MWSAILHIFSLNFYHYFRILIFFFKCKFPVSHTNFVAEIEAENASILWFFSYSNLNFLEFYAKKRCRVLITVETYPSPTAKLPLKVKSNLNFVPFSPKKSGKFEFYLTLKFPLLQICRVFCNINIKIQEEMQNKTNKTKNLW